MEQPDGFVVDGEEGKECKLLKSLYGLKQAPKQWHEKFERTLTTASFVVNEADKCVYYRRGGGERIILCLYVDDILIFGTSPNVIKEVKDFLSRYFEMKDLGVADVILNIKLLRDEDGGITLLQSHYVEKILSHFGYSDCKLKEICPRGNNKVVIYISLYHDKCLLFMLELYNRKLSTCVNT